MLGAAAMLLFGGCDVIGIRGNGNIVTEQRSVADFNEIVASGGMKVEWHTGAPSLTITTDENLLRHVEDRISGSTLRLKEHEHLRPTHGIKVTVSSPKFNGADLSGAVDLIAHNLTGAKFYVRGTGASDITVDGTVDELLADITGAGDLKAKALQVKTAQISTTGAADAVVNVTDALRVSITGAGDVDYYGNPPTIEKHITGAGSVRHKQ